MMHTSFIKTSVLGLAVASTSLFAEATYTPNKYQQNDWFAEFGGNTAMYVNPAGISETDQLEVSLGFFSTISGEASQEYASLTYPFDYKHTLGFSLFENGASIEGTKHILLLPSIQRFSILLANFSEDIFLPSISRVYT